MHACIHRCACAPCNHTAEQLAAAQENSTDKLPSPPHTHRSKLAEQHHARGYAARKQGRFDVAVEEYSKALALEPRHFKALFNRGFSYDKVCVHCVP